MQDSNAERRNLVFMSLMFIVYYYGEGEIVEKSLKVGLVNIEFNNLGFITIMAWLMLFWFFYRYWLVNKGEYEQKKVISGLYNLSIANTVFSKSLAYYAIKRKQEVSNLKRVLPKFISEQISIIDGVKIHPSCVQVYIYVYKPDNEQRPVKVGNRAERQMIVNYSNYGVLGLISKFIMILIPNLWFILTNSAFTDYIIPYCVFWVAITAPFFTA